MRTQRKPSAQMQATETKRTSWTQATTNPFKAIHSLVGCLQYGYHSWIELQENGKQNYPLKIKDEQGKWVVKPLKRKVFVVCFNSEKKELPLWVKLWNIIVYPLRFIPKKMVLHMPEYTCYWFRVGSVVHGFCVEFQIPKKFSFRD